MTHLITPSLPTSSLLHYPPHHSFITHLIIPSLPTSSLLHYPPHHSFITHLITPSLLTSSLLHDPPHHSFITHLITPSLPTSSLLHYPPHHSFITHLITPSLPTSSFLHYPPHHSFITHLVTPSLVTTPSLPTSSLLYYPPRHSFISYYSFMTHLITPSCLFSVMYTDSYTTRPTLNEVEKDLHVITVTEWKALGQNLDIPDHVLANVDSDRTLKDLKAHKRAMLKWWLENDREATWSKMSQALQGIHGNLAATICSKYGCKYLIELAVISQGFI